MTTTLTIEPITWNVIGLDSNMFADMGPDTFPVAVRVENTGDNDATNLEASFVWDSANALINSAGLTTLTHPLLAVNDTVDFYFNVVITRDSNAFGTVRKFHIDVTSDNAPTASTPTPRQVFVEKLISQNRNGVDSVVGPTSVTVGDTVAYTVTGFTAPSGYEQLEYFLDFPNEIFQVLSISATYPVDGPNDKVYADACLWDNDPNSVNYNSCMNPTDKAGGKPIVFTYMVKVIGVGTTELSGLLYDFSGSSFHYNDDFAIEITVTSNPPCLREGSQVAMYNQAAPQRIEYLRSGDVLVDCQGRPVLLRNNAKLYGATDKFVHIRRDALGPQLPERDLYVCTGHPVLYRGREVPCEALVNGDDITLEETDPATVYTLITDRRTFVRIHGVPVATWARSTWERTGIPCQKL